MPNHAASTRTLGEVLQWHRRQRFVGRTAEVELFQSALESSEPPFSALFVHGPGGIGKSRLLEVLAERARETGAHVKWVDGRDLPASSSAVQEALGELRGGATHRGPAGNRPVLVIDTYERLTPLDDWVRTGLLPSLPADALVVLAGRFAPGPGWRGDPAWRDRLRVVSLRNLGPEESRGYLAACGVPSHRHDALVAASHGHPLGLSLMADVVLRGGDAQVDPFAQDVVEALVRQFVDAVPTAVQRRALEVAALARITTEALLRETLEQDADPHALFSWLRGLSFMEARPEGLVPHELARDVLDVELRWRDPEGYRRTFRAVRAHVHGRLQRTAGAEQRRAIADEKYLFRNLPSILAPVDWSRWGSHDPEPARPADRNAIVDLVEAWEGGESAALAERWLHAQPGGFFVLRRRDGSVGGLLGLLDLTAAEPAHVHADPGTHAAWEYAQRHGPVRSGEALTQTRFVIDGDAYQAPSPTLNATPILTIQRYLGTPHLAWDFLTLAEPEPFDEYFAVADLPRAQGADFTVGGRRYGLFAHDFRRVPVDAWLERVTERALDQDFAASPPREPEVLVLAHASFEEAARQALQDLRRPDRLANNPLMRTGLLRGQARNRAPEVSDLEALLADAIDALRGHPQDEKLFRAVKRTYVQGAASQEAAAEALGVPFSTYRRHLSRGVARVVAWLWEREVYGAPP